MRKDLVEQGWLEQVDRVGNIPVYCLGERATGEHPVIPLREPDSASLANWLLNHLQGGARRCASHAASVRNRGGCRPVQRPPQSPRRRALMTKQLKVHDWRIEEREYARQEQRRGRRYAYEHLMSARTVLVVVDMVPFFVAEAPYALGIVANITRLATALRANGGTVAWILPAGTPAREDFFGPRVAEMLSHCAGTGPLHERIWPAFRVFDSDLVVEKTAASAFFPGRCPLPGLLEQRGIDTVLITGTVTNVCCESSARDASTLGYRVIMVADANAARRDEDHNAALYTIYRTFGDVRPTADLLELICKP
ncbi:isochorismatase family protein [Streptomyces sp. NPDC052396]|uniref:isochorismatase family protein n=1 Tax=Streptomyces sp. NPDC052396 TaxID=3365689 RepID=UPI0037D7152A